LLEVVVVVVVAGEIKVVEVLEDLEQPQALPCLLVLP
jgi:hypothetical protein